MRLPFGVHDEVRADFERRWSRARPLLLPGFLAPPLVGVVVALAATWSGPVVPAWALLLVGAVAPVWFLAGRAFVRRTGWWTGLVACAAVAQALGVWLLTLHPLLAAPTVATAAVALPLLARARAVLLEDAGDAIAGTTLGVRSASRQVRNHTGHPAPAHATFDGGVLRWHVGTGPSGPDFSGGELPLREITGVRVAGTRGEPAGEVVVVRAAGRDVELVVGDPRDFAALLDRRLRLLRRPGWS